MDAPADDFGPDRVCLAHDGSQGLLGDHVGQDDVGAGIGHQRARGGQRRHVGCEDVTALVFIGLARLLFRGHHDGAEFHAPDPEIVFQIADAGGAGLDTDPGAGQLLGAVQPQRLGRQEALAVIVGGHRKPQPEACGAREGFGGIARKDVDLAAPQRAEPVLAADGREAHLGGVAQGRGGHRAADVHVEAPPGATRIQQRKPREAGMDTAGHKSTRPHRVQGDALGGNIAWRDRRGLWRGRRRRRLDRRLRGVAAGEADRHQSQDRETADHCCSLNRRAG